MHSESPHSGCYARERKPKNPPAGLACRDKASIIVLYDLIPLLWVYVSRGKGNSSLVRPLKWVLEEVLVRQDVGTDLHIDVAVKAHCQVLVVWHNMGIGEGVVPLDKLGAIIPPAVFRVAIVLPFGNICKVLGEPGIYIVDSWKSQINVNNIVI